MRIAYINNYYQLGGAETVMRQLHAGMTRYGHQSQILVADGKTYPRGHDVFPLYPRLLSRLEHSRLNRTVSKYVPRSRWTDHAVRRLANSSYDIIHVHNFHGLYASIETLADLVRAKPLVWTFHRFWGVTGGCDHPFGCLRYKSGCGECPQVGNFAVGPNDQTSEQWRMKMRLLRPLPLTIVAPSEHLANLVRSSPIGENWNTVIIPNGIDTSSFNSSRKRSPQLRVRLGLDPGKTIILFTNRNFRDPIKGWPVVREALNCVSPTGLQIVLAGGGSSWAMTQLSSAWDTVDLGYLSNREMLARVYEVADIFLYASSGENFPCAILEAMASSCCIVSTPVDGVLEQVVHSESALLSETNDGQSLARCLTEALRDPNRLVELGSAARDRVMRLFSEEQMNHSHEKLYQDLLSRRTPQQ